MGDRPQRWHWIRFRIGHRLSLLSSSFKGVPSERTHRQTSCCCPVGSSPTFPASSKPPRSTWTLRQSPRLSPLRREVHERERAGNAAASLWPGDIQCEEGEFPTQTCDAQRSRSTTERTVRHFEYRLLRRRTIASRLGTGSAPRASPCGHCHHGTHVTHTHARTHTNIQKHLCQVFLFQDG